MFDKEIKEQNPEALKKRLIDWFGFEKVHW